MVKKISEEKAETHSKEDIKKSSRSNRARYLFIIVLVLAVLGSSLYYFRGIFVAATVNGTPITRLETIRELEKQAGAQALESLVTQKLIEQEAQKRGITVSEEEINEELANIKSRLEQQGQSLPTILEMQGLTQDEVKENLRFQVLIDKMTADDVAVSDEEVDQFIEENQENIADEQDEEEVRGQVRTQLERQKASTAAQGLVSQLREGASINYYVDYAN